MKSGGLELHGIKHLSPSSLNAFVMQPAVWVLERLLNKKAPVGCSAHRGTAAEAGIVHGLQNMQASVVECQDAAMSVFDRLTALSADHRRAKERDAVPGIVAVGLKELRQYGQPSSYQGRVEHRFEGLSVPILGFYDVRWDEHGITLDIKSQLKLSSEISSSHARQVALYVHSTNHQGRVGYFTPAKAGVYVLENPADHMAALVNIAMRLDRFLAISADPLELASFMVPDLDHFVFSDPIAQANAAEVFGFQRPAQAAASTLSTPEATAA